MTKFGIRRSDGQAYPKSRKSKLRKTGTTEAKGRPTKPSNHKAMYAKRDNPTVAVNSNDGDTIPINTNRKVISKNEYEKLLEVGNKKFIVNGKGGGQSIGSVGGHEPSYEIENTILAPNRSEAIKEFKLKHHRQSFSHIKVKKA